MAERLESWAGATLPSTGEVRTAAYERWLRRGLPHGSDRDDWLAAECDLTFHLNYRTIVEYRLDGGSPLTLDDQLPRYCRFCERTAGQVAFGPPVPLLAGGCSPSLYSAAVCNECCEAFRDVQAARLERFRATLAEDTVRSAGTSGTRASDAYSLDVFKSLVGCALTIMPESELGYFVDALEWVSNPDVQSDGSLFERDASCVAYLAPFLGERSWTSIARRINQDVPLPYIVYFLAMRGVVMQVSLPLCICDQDLDGRAVRVPRRSFAAGEGGSFEQARVMEFWVNGRW